MHSFVFLPYRRFSCTGIDVVPCSFCDMISSSPNTIGPLSLTTPPRADATDGFVNVRIGSRDDATKLDRNARRLCSAVEELSLSPVVGKENVGDTDGALCPPSRLLKARAPPKLPLMMRVDSSRDLAMVLYCVFVCAVYNMRHVPSTSIL